jgi:hypothetical protein
LRALREFEDYGRPLSQSGIRAAPHFFKSEAVVRRENDRRLWRDARKTIEFKLAAPVRDALLGDSNGR